MSDTSRDVTVELDDPGSGIAVLLDDATSRIVELETRGYRPRILSVPPAVYERISKVHAPDLARGVPLIVLGLTLVSAEP